jgi:hypothetical protein
LQQRRQQWVLFAAGGGSVTPPQGAGHGPAKRTIAEANALKQAIPLVVKAAKRARKRKHRDYMLEYYEGIAPDEDQPAMPRGSQR